MTVNVCVKLAPARTHTIPHPNVPPHDFLRTNFTVPRTEVTIWTAACERSGAVIVCSVYITPLRVAWLMFRNSKKREGKICKQYTQQERRVCVKLDSSGPSSRRFD